VKTYLRSLRMGWIHRGPGLLVQARHRGREFPARNRSDVEAIYGTGALAKGWNGTIDQRASPCLCIHTTPAIQWR
jgi:hypothetical protein